MSYYSGKCQENGSKRDRQDIKRSLSDSGRRRRTFWQLVELENKGMGINDSDPLFNDIWIQLKPPMGLESKQKHFLNKI